MTYKNKLKIGDAAPDVPVVNADGDTLALSAVWTDQPSVLVFLRHFG
jgi:peroxiredoxin